MIWAAPFLLLFFGGSAYEGFAAEVKAATKRPSAGAKPLTLGAFVEHVLAGGAPGSIPVQIGSLIELTAAAPYYGVIVSSEQTTDGIGHSIRVLVEKVSDSETAKPLGLALECNRRSPGVKEGYWFRASLDGTLEKVAVIQGKLDEAGKSIKGSGTTEGSDINSPEVKKRFQHELDLWLKRTYLKREWRSAEFSGGVLKKKAAR